MKAANSGLVDKAIDAVDGVIKTIIKFKDMLLNVLAKAADVIGDIISDPIGFLGNLVDAVKAGLKSFVGNIGTHLQEGLMGWLFGALGDAGIQLPEDASTCGHPRPRDAGSRPHLREHPRPRRRSSSASRSWRARADRRRLQGLMTEGRRRALEVDQGQGRRPRGHGPRRHQGLRHREVIKAGITWLIGLLNPASAFIKACKAIYDIVMFFIERGAQIMDFVNAILDSIGAIAKGNIGAAAE